MSFKEIDKYYNEISKQKYQCKKCGRKQIIPAYVDKLVCSWCGHYVYKSDRDEFKDRLRGAMKSEKQNKGFIQCN